MGSTPEIFTHFGPVAAFLLLFLVVGIGMWINILWGLLTGGPRALQEPGAPYLYDRLYYLLHVVALVGWSGCLLSFTAFTELGDYGSGFMIGWGVCAVGMGLLFFLRGDMLVRAEQYLAAHGFWLTRIFHKSAARTFTRHGSWFRKPLGGLFAVIGVGVLAFNLPHFPDALRQLQAGSTNLLHIFTSLPGLSSLHK